MNRPFQLSNFAPFVFTKTRSKRRRRGKDLHTFVALEDRNLLASLTVSTVGFGDQLQFTSDSGVADVVSVETTDAGDIQVRVQGDSISVPSAITNNGAVELTSFATENDTLTITPTADFGSGFGRLNVISVNLGDQADSLSIDIDSNNFAFNETLALIFDGGSGDDNIDASASSSAVRIFGGAGSDRIFGGSGNDTILGDQTDQDGGQDVLFGGAGNDFLSGFGGADTLVGGAGNDTLAGGEGVDTIDGGTGTDINSFDGINSSVTAVATESGSGTVEHGTVSETFVGVEGLQASGSGDALTIEGDTGGILIGGNGDDVLTGGSGNDRLVGRGGNDILTGGAGDDNLLGNEGDDIIRGGDGNDRLVGNAGDDTLLGNDGDDESFGGFGNDTLNGGAGNDTLHGEGDDDFFVGLGGTDTIFGGDGVDTNSFQGVGNAVTATILEDGSGTASYGAVDETFSDIENLVGTIFDDVLRVEASHATILRGLAGNDLLVGGSGDDILDGNSGDDVLRGGDGDDTILGRTGDDVLNGNGGDDRLFGEAGNDFLVGLGGVDLIHGGDGIDTNPFQGVGSGVTATITVSNCGTAQYGLVEEFFTGIENLTGSEHDDVLNVFTQANTVIRGLGGNDILTSSSGNDLLFGEAGNDILRSGAGNDTSRGGLGNDSLNGGDGNDTLFGDEGDDYFVGIEGTDSIFGGLGFDINSFIDFDVDVNVVRRPDGTGTAEHGTVFETFSGIDGFVNAFVTEVAAL